MLIVRAAHRHRTRTPNDSLHLLIQKYRTAGICNAGRQQLGYRFVSRRYAKYAVTLMRILGALLFRERGDSDDVLIRRFEGNRRRHPFPAPTLADSIAGERAQLQSIRDAADLVFDTGSINVNQLRSRIVETFTELNSQDSLRVSLVSFGYSNGIPRDVDLVFDCRFLPNPHWIDELRPLSGLDEAVANYVLEQEAAQHFLHDVVQLLEWQIPAFAKEGKSYLSIAIGCTGGRHRSVAISEEIRRRLNIHHPVVHRDIGR